LVDDDFDCYLVTLQDHGGKSGNQVLLVNGILVHSVLFNMLSCPALFHVVLALLKEKEKNL